MEPSISENQTERPLRVLEMCTVFGTGGIARHALDLQRWLNARGHQVLLCGTAGEWAGPDADADFLSIPTLYVASEGGNIFVRLGHTALSVWAMRRWLSRNPVDLIHAHESAPALVAKLASWGRGIPLIVTYHGSDPERVASFGSIARRADLVITPSQRSGDDLVERGRVARAKLKVIGLGIKPAPQDDPTSVAALRQELLGDGTHLIVTLARIAYQKGIDILIDCVAQLKKSHPQFRFVVVGEGPMQDEMLEKARELGVQSHLNFAGQSAHPSQYLRAGDLMLLTSRWEALPISIVEAFQTGTPVVATDCSGVAELVDGDVGACVPKGNVTAICAAVVDTLDNDAVLRDRSAAALLRSQEDRFDPDFINRQFENTYYDLISGS